MRNSTHAVGTARRIGTAGVLSLAVVGCILAAMVRRIGVEEDALRRGLGPGEYERYAASRARLVPGVW